MLKLITGNAGSGKTAAILEEIRVLGEQGQSSVLIVPEQYSHNAERRLCAVCGDGLSLYGEVLSFSRLASRAGCPASLRTLDKGGRFLCMERALHEVMTQLKILSSANRFSLPGQLLAVYDQFRSSSVTARQAAEAVKDLPGRLSRLLEDMELVFQAYQATIPEDLFDPADVMDQLASRISQSGAVAGKNIYIDGFTDFTGQEQAILRELLMGGNDCTVTLTVSDTPFDGGADQIPRETVRKLIRLAESTGTELRQEKFSPRRDRSEALLYLTEHLFDPAPESFSVQTDTISLYTAPDVTGECELAASLVHQLVREKKLRWREIAVAARGWESYAPTVSFAFEKYNIPVIPTAKTSLCDNAAVVSLLDALDCVCRDWDGESLLSWLHSGYAGLEREKIDRLENYLLQWNLRGSSVWRRADWTMGVDGYGETVSEEKAHQLFNLNETRRFLAGLLGRLEDSLCQAENAREMAMALYEFLKEAGYEKKLACDASLLRRRGEMRLCAETEQVWDRLMTALEQFAAVLGEVSLKPEEFSRLFRLLLMQYEVGTIPSVVDSVGLGEMNRMRRQGVRCLVILGADDSRLPTVGGGDSLLSDMDCAELMSHGIELMDTAEGRLNREMNVLVSSLSLPKDRLILIRTGEDGGKRPSFVTTRASKLFGLTEKRPGREMLLEAPMPCFELACTGKKTGSPEAAEAERVLSEDPVWRERLEAARRASYVPRGRLSPETAKKLYRDTLNLTASKVEAFQSCRFSHFLRYGLKVKPRKTVGLDAPEAGNYIHFLMENVAREAGKMGGFQNLNRETCKELTDRYSKVYLAEYLGGLENKSGRFQYLFGRLTEDAVKIVWDMASELASSDFTPLDFELEFAPNGDMDPISMGENTAIWGKVDRVDGWLSDGKLYLRVIDYKTGKKSFSLSDVWYGMGMQMLMYLFALWEKGDKRYGHEIVPAGVLYAPARDVVIQAERQDTEADWQNKRTKELKRSGLLLADEAVLEAMEHGEHKILPVKIKKDGTLTEDNLATAEQLGVLRRYVEQTLGEIGEAIHSGAIEANPYFRGVQDNACLYCDYFEACHFREEDGCDKKHYLTTLKTPEVWEKMKEVVENG